MICFYCTCLTAKPFFFSLVAPIIGALYFLLQSDIKLLRCSLFLFQGIVSKLWLIMVHGSGFLSSCHLHCPLNMAKEFSLDSLVHIICAKEHGHALMCIVTHI